MAAFEIAKVVKEGRKEKFRKVGDISLKVGNFDLAENCYKESEDLNSLFLIY